MKKILSFLLTGLCFISCIFMLTSSVNADPPKVGSTVRFLYSNLGGDSYENNVSSFDLHHVRPYYKGTMLEGKLNYKLMLGLDKNFASAKVLDAYGDYKLADIVIVRFGQYKVPFDRQYLTSLTGLQFINRGAGGLKSFKRDRGVTLRGTVTKYFVTYDLGIFNGTGITTNFNAKNNSGNDNQQHLFAGRVTINPQGVYGYKLALLGKTDELKTALGFGFATGQQAIETDVLAYCFDVAVCNKGITAMVEYQNKEVEKAGLKTTTTGITGQAGYFVLPTLETMARYSKKEIKNGSKTNEMTFGANYYLDSNNAKLQLNYTRLENVPTSGDNAVDNMVQLLYQMVF